MIVDGVELLRLIRDKKIKAGTKIKWGERRLYFDGDNIVFDGSEQKLLNTLWDANFASLNYEILSEEDKEIDIQALEEIKRIDFNGIGKTAKLDIESLREIGLKINDLIKAIKQLDKKLEN